MKRVIGFIVVLMMFFACENSTSEKGERLDLSKNTQLSENDQIKQHLVNSGFSVKTIEFTDEKVSLGSDAHFLRADLLEDIAYEKTLAESQRSKHYSTNYVVSASNASNITVSISGLTSEWQTHTSYAIDQWNSISGSSLHFSISTKKKS